MSLLLQEAEKSMRFYKNIQKTETDRVLLEFEMNKTKCIVDENRNQHGKSLRWMHFTSKIVRKAFAIGIVLVVLSTCTGAATMKPYATLVFQTIGSHFSPNVSTIIIGFVNLIGVFVAVVLVDRLGRKVFQI